MLKRGLSGVAFLVLMVGGILFCRYAFGLLFLGLMLFTLFEFYRLVDAAAGMRIPRWQGLVGAASLFVYSWLEAYGMSVGWVSGILFSLLLVSLAALPVFGVLRYRIGAFAQWAWQMLGLVYVAIPFSLSTWLAADTAQLVNVSWIRNGELLLAVLVLVWINDTGAYLVGSALGRHRLIERVSPKKSWEGFFGGLLLATIAGWCIGVYLFNLSGVLWSLLGLLVGLSAVVGDLIESLLKRWVGVKDSGHFLPGHGGFLDRFDAMLLAVPVSVVFLFLSHSFR